MKVWKRGVHDSPLDFYSDDKDPIKEKVIFWAPIYSIAIGKYFYERSYGVGVQEVLYREFCLKEGYNDKLLYYGPRKKLIDCAVVLDYAKVLSMDNNEYGKYLASLYLERSSQFTELKIKNFDFKKYIDDLRDFFQANNLL